MDITPDKKRLLDLVERARSGEIALPEFQRNFVWTRDDVRDLLTSVLKGYFIGSFLLLKVDAESSPFAFRAVAGVEKPAEQLKPPQQGVPLLRQGAGRVERFKMPGGTRPSGKR
ncbi:MAG: DUF262 domain-containing protein [Firmicutes bacterium]|nr:DUF262 domain-containing protein [Bacillota bacterium]